MFEFSALYPPESHSKLFSVSDSDLCPAVDIKENQDAAHSPITLSVSRLSCIEDEVARSPHCIYRLSLAFSWLYFQHLVNEFLETFPHVRYEQDITPSSTHVVMMNSCEFPLPLFFPCFDLAMTFCRYRSSLNVFIFELLFLI